MDLNLSLHQVSWSKLNTEPSGHTEILSGNKYLIHPNGSLSIFDVQKTENGTYVVELSNSYGVTPVEIEVLLRQRTGILTFLILRI